MTIKSRFLNALGMILFFAAVTRAQCQTNDYDARARQIVSQMTLEEKITELHGIHDSEHQRYVPGIPRLNIPGLRVANGPAGVGPGDEHPHQLPATAMPAPIALGATWDTDLAHRYGVVLGKEARLMNDDLLEAPDINIARVPQNGRTFEAFGEDPYLVGRLSVNVIQGIQSQGEIANVKHYAANNQEENRFTINEIISERALREIYLPAFEASIKEGHSASLMSAYPKVNGEYCCQNDILQNQILKNEWGFQGFITSDFGAVHSTVPSAMAGLDLEMPTGKYFGTNLLEAVKEGKIPMSVIDDKLIRRFRTMMQYGLFDHPPVAGPVPQQADGMEARTIAQEGMVLLKNNDNLLPLDVKKIKSIALIGPYACKAMTGGGGSSHVLPLYTVDPLTGIQSRVRRRIKVQYDSGDNLNQAVALAKSSDVVILMVGDDATEGKDHSIMLAGMQNILIEKIATANPRTVLVLKTGSPVLMPWADQVPAILEAWYPGEEDGNAVAAVLFGDVNPSGKLPMTFPRRMADLSANTPESYPGVDGTVTYSDDIFVGYRHYDAHKIEPLFPFGYGLSYTTFGYKNLTLSTNSISLESNSNPRLSVDLDVTNTGQRAGKEVVQLYMGLPSSDDVPQPPSQLKRFAKVSLNPGETRRVHFDLDARAMSYWNTKKHGWEILPGAYQVKVGSSSRDLPLQATFQVD